MANGSLQKCAYYPFPYRRARRLANTIRRYIPPGTSVLDVGCGNMLISQELRDSLEIQVRGIDVLDMNLTDLPHQIFDGERIPFSDDKFDVSLLIYVLHHVENQKVLLEETKRVTRKRIILFEDIYFSELGKFWLKVRDFTGNFPEEMEMNFAFNFRSLEEWERVFIRQRLEMVHKKVFFNLPRLTYHAFCVLEKGKDGRLTLQRSGGGN